MSRRKWTTVSRYRDGLIDPSWRAVINDRGIEWVTDRFTIVRTDMFTVRVTARGYGADQVRPARVRAILDRRPAFVPFVGAADILGLAGDGEEAALVVRSGSGGSSASLFQPSIRPLLDACDSLRVKEGTLFGYQRRPRCADPVLVAAVQPIRWSEHYLKRVTR